MAKTKNEAGAFLQALKSELDGVRNDLKKDLARQVYGDGTAKIAVGTAGSTTTLTVSTEPIRKGQIYPGMLVDIFDVSALTTAATYTGIEVQSANLSTGVVTFTTTLAGALASGDYIVRAGVALGSNNEASTYSKSDEVDGLQRIVDVATSNSLGGIDVTATQNTWWDNQRLVASSGDFDSATAGTQGLSMSLIQQGLNKARIAGGTPTSIITSLGVQREFYNLMTTYVRYVEPQNHSYSAGFKTLDYQGMPVVADIDAPYGKMYILDESTIKVFSDQDWHFLDADGLTLRQVAGRDKFEAVLARYMNLGATRRNNQIVISGIYVDGAADAGF
jgi:hypothetical protein